MREGLGAGGLDFPLMVLGVSTDSWNIPLMGLEVVKVSMGSGMGLDFQSITFSREIKKDSDTDVCMISRDLSEAFLIGDMSWRKSH